MKHLLKLATEPPSPESHPLAKRNKKAHNSGGKYVCLSRKKRKKKSTNQKTSKFMTKTYTVSYFPPFLEVSLNYIV